MRTLYLVIALLNALLVFSQNNLSWVQTTNKSKKFSQLLPHGYTFRKDSLVETYSFTYDSIIEMRTSFCNWGSTQHKIHPDFANVSTIDFMVDRFIKELQNGITSTVMGNGNYIRPVLSTNTRELVIETDSIPHYPAHIWMFIIDDNQKEILISTLSGPKSRISDIWFLRNKFLNSLYQYVEN